MIATPAAYIKRHLHEALASGRYAGGDKLPTERALASELQVSRSAVRDALNLLESEGRIVRIVGSGTYVAEAPAAGTERWAPKLSSPAEIMEARLLIEPRLARLAVLHATSTDLDRAARSHEGAMAADEYDAFERWDAAFHQAIALATHNRLLVSLYEGVTEARDQADWGELKRRSLTAERRDLYRREHGTILEALRARDADAVDAAATQHLRTVRANLLGT